VRGEFVSNEEFFQATGEYFETLDKRIKRCERLLDGKDKFLVYYTLAQLFSRYDMDELPDYPRKKKACYYAKPTLKEDPSCAPAWALIAEKI